LSRFFLKWLVPSMTNDEDNFFPTNFFEGFHGSVGHLKQTMCYLYAWNDSSGQNLNTLRDAKNLRKDVDVLKMELKIGKEVGGWVGLHHFLLIMIFWWPRNLNYHCRKRRKLWNTMEVNWFFYHAFSCTILLLFHLTMVPLHFSR